MGKHLFSYPTVIELRPGEQTAPRRRGEEDPAEVWQAEPGAPVTGRAEVAQAEPAARATQLPAGPPTEASA